MVANTRGRKSRFIAAETRVLVRCRIMKNRHAIAVKACLRIDCSGQHSLESELVAIAMPRVPRRPLFRGVLEFRLITCGGNYVGERAASG